MGMTHLRLSEHFDAPVDRVFALGTDFKRYPEWNVSYREVREVTGPVDHVGTKVFATMNILGRPMDGWSEIVDVDRPRYLKMVGVGPQDSRLTLIYRATPAGGGTDFESEIDYDLPAGILGAVADRMFVEGVIQRAMRHSMENFKALVEAKTPVTV
jgi:uncharacterized membrane protein